MATPTSIPVSELSADALRGASHSVRNPKAELDDQVLVARAKAGDRRAADHLIRRYQKFVRLKSSSYFLVGGDADDLMQEGLVGLYKAIRDYRSDRESSFRSFAELCITRQIITAVKSATRNKHVPLNQYVSFGQSPAAGGENDSTMEEILPGPACADPVNQAISSEELACLVACLQGSLSEMEASVLGYYLEDRSYEDVAGLLDCDTKTVDNALQRVKRKVIRHLESREVAV